jgi:uncharacterized protein
MKAMLCAVLVVLFWSTVSLPLAFAGVDEGVVAYDQGNYVTALREFRIAALNGDARAQYNLGVMYRTGNGVSQDYQEADRWYRNASEHGHVLAQFSLGLMYKEGFIGKKYVQDQGIVNNYVKAYKWFSIAAAGGHTLSEETMGTIVDKMSDDEVLTAQNLAQKWMEIWPVVSE